MPDGGWCWGTEVVVEGVRRQAFQGEEIAMAKAPRLYPFILLHLKLCPPPASFYIPLVLDLHWPPSSPLVFLPQDGALPIVLKLFLLQDWSTLTHCFCPKSNIPAH